MHIVGAKQVVEVLKAQLPVDNKALDSIAADPHSELWRRWDPDGSGQLATDLCLELKSCCSAAVRPVRRS